MQLPDSSLQEKTKGVMQGGVISPVLSNLFLHYVFDVWVKRKYPEIPWCRYADDGIAHCKTEEQAQQLLSELQQRFNECGLELHPSKTKIIYCKDENRKGSYPNTKFEFLGYCFRRRQAQNKNGKLFLSFAPAVSKSALKSMRAKTRRQKFYKRTELSLSGIAAKFNPILRGWIEYYGRYNRSSLYPVLNHFNRTLVAWAMRKYKKLKEHKTRTIDFLENILKRDPYVFAHWKIGMIGAFA